MNPFHVVAAISLVALAVLAVMMPDLLLAAVGLALASAVLAILMFMMGASWAAVMELSVCAGLITAVFVSVICLTKPMTKPESRAFAKKKLAKFFMLPLVVIGLGLVFAKFFDVNMIPFDISGVSGATNDFRNIMWLQRPLDIIGQIAIILTGIFGVVILFKRLSDGKKEGK